MGARQTGKAGPGRPMPGWAIEEGRADAGTDTALVDLGVRNQVNVWSAKPARPRSGRLGFGSVAFLWRFF